MASRNLPQIGLSLPHLWLELLVKLFAIGIFSVEGGAKAWFELILVSAALCASGYILWWQIPLLILAIILGTLAAGVFSLLAPKYMEAKDLTATHQIASTLKTLSEYNLKEISSLSEDDLEQRLEQIYKAQQILEKNPKLVEQLSELQSALRNINQSHNIASAEIKNINQVKEKKKKEAELKRKETESEFTGGCPPDYRYSPPRCREGYPIKVIKDKKLDGADGIIWKPSDTEYKKKVKNIFRCYKSVEEAEKECGKYRFRRPKNSNGEPRA